jgi:hypothetical protein
MPQVRASEALPTEERWQRPTRCPSRPPTGITRCRRDLRAWSPILRQHRQHRLRH